MLHFDGTRFERRDLPSRADVWQLWGTSANDVWALAGDEPGEIHHWNGRRWRPRRRGLGRRPITAPGGAAGDVYAAGPTGVVHWNGRRWQNVVRVTRTRSDAFTSICATRTHVFIAETRSAVIPARVWMRPRRDPEGER